MILSHKLLYHTKVVINLNSSLVSLVLPISLILQIPNPFFPWPVILIFFYTVSTKTLPLDPQLYSLHSL